MKKLLLLLLSAYSTFAFAQTTPLPTIQKLYKAKCARCHGKTGDKGVFHASKLSQSTLDDASIVRLIQEGKGIMPAFGKKLTEGEVKEMVGYVKTLRK